MDKWGSCLIFILDTKQKGHLGANLCFAVQFEEMQVRKGGIFVNPD